MGDKVENPKVHLLITLKDMKETILEEIMGDPFLELKLKATGLPWAA